jgi:hypothetical protein
MKLVLTALLYFLRCFTLKREKLHLRMGNTYRKVTTDFTLKIYLKYFVKRWFIVNISNIKFVKMAASSVDSIPIVF